MSQKRKQRSAKSQKRRSQYRSLSISKKRLAQIAKGLTYNFDVIDPLGKNEVKNIVFGHTSPVFRIKCRGIFVQMRDWLFQTQLYWRLTVRVITEYDNGTKQHEDYQFEVKDCLDGREMNIALDESLKDAKKCCDSSKTTKIEVSGICGGEQGHGFSDEFSEEEDVSTILLQQAKGK